MNEGEIVSLLDGLVDGEIDYVVQRVRCNSDQKAISRAGVCKTTFYGGWSQERRRYLFEVVQKIKRIVATNNIVNHKEEITESFSSSNNELEDNEFVYFIKAGETVKIGYARNVDKRIKNLQTSNSQKLELLGYMPGTKEDEAELHRLFDDYRLTGEWFEYSDEIRDYIANIDLITGEEQACQSETQAENFNRA